MFRPFRIKAEQMTVARLGLQVTNPAAIARVNSVLANFAAGFNRMITAPNNADWREYLKTLPPLYQPFAHEGVAMGYILRGMARFHGADFEREVVRAEPGMRYLYYVGLGFWAGMRSYSPSRLEKLVADLDPLHRYLCYDGYGFKVAFFDCPTDPGALSRLRRIDGYSRHAAFHGVGRALWFRHMNSTDVLVERLRELEEHAVDAAAGLGLASVFVSPDRLDAAQSLGRDLPSEWHPHFHLGMCFALKARVINHPDLFDQFMQNASPAVRDSALASIRECDRIELQIRAEASNEALAPWGYREWRRRVTSWMEDNIQFPLNGVKAARPTAVHDETRSPENSEYAEMREDD
ncbi:MAG: DUF1702 family protein [Planctomycetota bacterium]